MACGWLRCVVKSRTIDDGGLVGVLCTPATEGSTAGVLLLGGSEGGLHEHDARVLAAEGFTVLALAYFGAPGLPPGLVDVPLEYFFRALDLLAVQPGVDRIALLGGSRGGEAALLVAAHDERVNTVVSVVGGGVLTQGIDYRRGPLLDILTTPTASWTLNGRPLPYMPYVVPEELQQRVAAGIPVPLHLAFQQPPTDPAELERVSIPVERINGPVLLISAEDDQMWPGSAYSQVAIDRLTAASHPHPFEHRVFKGAGHTIAGPPGEPFTTTTAPGPGVTFELGGTPTITTAARTQAWSTTITFLKAHLP